MLLKSFINRRNNYTEAYLYTKLIANYIKINENFVLNMVYIFNSNTVHQQGLSTYAVVVYSFYHVYGAVGDVNSFVMVGPLYKHLFPQIRSFPNIRLFLSFLYIRFLLPSLHIPSFHQIDLILVSLPFVLFLVFSSLTLLTKSFSANP